MSFSVAGKTALVTGANRGIGEAIVDALFAAGANKIYAGARNLVDLAPLVARHGSKVVALELDITNSAHIALATAKAGDVQLLVNNAGVSAQPGTNFTDAQWITSGRQEMEVNYFGTLAMLQAFAPVLAANGGGAIVNIASVVSFVPLPTSISYSASKAAIHSITLAARMLLRAQGTQVFGVYPGPIETRMAESIPLAKATPADAARAIVAAMESGTDDIFPDPMSESLGAVYLSDPKNLERQIEAMVVGTHAA